MNFNRLTKGFTKVVPVIALSAIMISCNDENAGNTSTTGRMDTTSMNTDGSPAGSPTTVAPANQGTAATAVSLDSSAAGVAGKSARKGRVMAAMAADDMKSKMAMDKMGYYNRAEVAPSFAGGQAGLENYITTNLEYPNTAIDNNIEGEVRVQFAVDNQGNISNVSTVGKKIGYGLEEEAIKVVSAMPKWTAGTVKGKAVKTWRTLPITYKLES